MKGTAHEALIAELLGDVGVLHDEVKALRQVLPSAADQMAVQIEQRSAVVLEQLDVTLGVLTDAARRLRDDSAILTTAVRRAADQAAAVAGDKAIDKVAEVSHCEAKRLKAAADDLAREIGTSAAVEVQRQVAKPVAAAVDDVTSVARGLDAAKSELEKATSKIRVVMWQRVAWTAAAALLGAGVALGSAHALGWTSGGMTAEQYKTLVGNQQTIYQACQPGQAGRK